MSSYKWVVVETYRHDTWVYGPYETLAEVEVAAAELEDEVPEDERDADDGFNEHKFDFVELVPPPKKRKQPDVHSPAEPAS